jgi:hypothetical protein
MLRLTLMLSAAIYAVLVIYSERPAPSGDAPVEVTRAAASSDRAAPAWTAGSGRIVTTDGRSLEIAAEIDPLALQDGSRTIPRVSTRAPDTVTASASAGLPQAPLVEVTGTSVNLRAGPSTGDAVLDALTRGARAELIAASDDGWAQIRTVETGTVGYMADRFLSPVN